MKNKFFLGLFCLGLFSCSSSSAPKTSQVKLSQDTFVTIGSGARNLQKKGETVELKDNSPILLESPGYIGMLIVPLKDAAAQLEPTLKPVDGWSGEVFEKIVNSKLNEIVQETNAIQILLSSGKGKEAFEKVDLLQKKYPQVTYLNFYRASALYVLGEKENVKNALKVALKDFPDQIEVRNFYKSLGGVE
ncbi:MAG: hypothetical protein WCK43_08740 [bacterium]